MIAMRTTPMMSVMIVVMMVMKKKKKKRGKMSRADNCADHCNRHGNVDAYGDDADGADGDGARVVPAVAAVVAIRTTF